jgi:hypothetical protein
MTPKRPQSLKWVGTALPDGRPERYLEFVAPRDLTEDETDALSQEQLAVIRQHPDLYKEVHAPEPKKNAAPKKKALGIDSDGKSFTASDLERATLQEIPAGDQSSTAAETATESEG